MNDICSFCYYTDIQRSMCHSLLDLYFENIAMLLIKQLTTNVPHHTETSQLICNVNQLIGFYMMGNIDR